MGSISGYQILEQLNENSNYILWKGLDSHNRPIICKVLKWDSVNPREKALLRNEYEILKSFEGKPYIIQVYELIEKEDTFALVQEDFGGKSIRSLLNERKFTLPEILKIGISAASALSQIHSSGVIHKDINPANLVLNPETGEMKIIDFGISERISLKSFSLDNPDKLEGTLAYISPEQTGRMNRHIDHRSDLYSLGITLYELFCGTIPFTSSDPLEIVHAHIATYPLDPSTVNPNLPEVISEIINKLLEKIGEARYQSALGLKYDLEKCLNSLLTSGTVEKFEIAKNDFSSSFQIPQKLFGRQEDIIQLFDAYTNAFEGNKTSVLIEGLSGAGKSALVHELFKILKNFPGVKTYYISGKFDQFQKSIPYYAFNKAFNSYISFLLSENKDFISSKKVEILEALGGMGRVLLEIIPDLELITGKLENIDELDASQAQNRLFYVFKKFILAICNNTNPVVLFIDDLQWVDSGSLGLIKILFNDSDIKHLLFIGAYRNNEITPGHPFSILLSESKEKGANIETILVDNLKIGDIKLLVSETLYKSEADITELAELIFSKTSGNPFFVNQFLKSLYEKNLIYFDYSNSNHPEWKWDFDKILYEKITDNVVILMTEKIRELSTEAVFSLQIASCLGNRFSLRMLALILEKDLKESFSILWQAIQKNLLIPIGEYKIILMSKGNDDFPNEFDLEINFIHDRVQQSAYSLIKEVTKKNLHHKIGKMYFAKMTKEERLERIFEIIHHLNYGSELFETELEKLELAKLNLETGRRAKLSGAYEAALVYFEKGIDLLKQVTGSEEILLLNLAFNTEASESSWLLGQMDKMHSYAKLSLSLARYPLEKVKTYKVLITFYVSSGLGIEAIHRAVEILKELGVNTSPFPSQLSVISELIKTKLTLAGKKMEDLGNLPKLENPTSLAIMEILSVASSPAYSNSPNLLPILVFKQVSITAKQGFTLASSFAYTTLALIYCGVLNDITSGYEFGKLGMSLLGKVPSAEFKGKTITVYNGFVHFWKESLRSTLDSLLEGYKISLETGDLEYAGIGCYLYCLHSMLVGKELRNLEIEMEIYDKVLDNLNQSNRLPYFKMFYQYIYNFTGKQEFPASLNGKIFSPEKSLPILKERKDRNGFFTINFLQGILEYHFGSIDSAIEYLDESEKDAETVIASPNLPLSIFYQSLVHIRYAKDKGSKIKRASLKIIKRNQKRILFWSKHSPTNFLHKYYLVEAELAGLLQKENKAKEYYDLAILYARQNEYIQEEALSWELGGKFFAGRNEILAEMYMQKAYTCYLKWGSFAKTKSLESLYPVYIRNLKALQLHKDAANRTKTNILNLTDRANSSTTSRMDNLDLNSILKASQALSSEIDLAILISSLMKVMAENAGAEKGYLIIEEDGVFWIEAKYGADKEEFVRTPLSEFENMAISIVNYVINSKTSIVLDNAFEQSNHTDTYIKSSKPKSILCMPLLNRGEMSGILYLENNLISGAFTPQSLNLLNLLSSQAAISIQNARFYKHLKQVNQAYERFVPREFLQLLEKKSILDVELGQFTQRQMTVLFCDIRDFTTLSEEMNPEENFKFINSFLRRMEPAISKNKGFIDKYIGDAIMALFSLRADDALLAALEMRVNLAGYNLHREKSNYYPIRIGIGINTGDLMLGTIGGKSRMDGTVISDSVNLAARIESLTKTFHTPILVSEYLVEKLQNKNQFYLREVDRVKVKGKEKPVTIFECFNCDKQDVIDRKLETLDKYNSGLKAFREGNLKEAKIYFMDCQRICPEDPIPVIYINRCNNLLSENTDNTINSSFLGAEPAGSKKILLIDDNYAMLEYMAHIFSKNRYEVILAESEKDALVKYESFRPDFVLTDLNLEHGGNGYSLIQSIKRIGVRYNINPILILITADISQDAESKAKQMGADLFFKKPIHFDSLFEKLNVAMANKGLSN
ncbi:MAG: AAA family ATPase [Leptospiraceae bacterium]|nr:AAA family ATPase [Leptospiraceae bacterium]